MDHSSLARGAQLGPSCLCPALPYPLFRPRRFWQDTLRTDSATVVVYYENGMLYPVVYVRGGGRHHPPPVAARRFVGPHAENEKDWLMGLISDILGAAANTAVGQAAADPAFEKRLPTLFAFMTAVVEDGKPREPSSLTVFTQDGQWKCVLNEKETGLQLWRTAETFEKLLGSLEKALTSGNPDWRRSAAANARGGARKGRK